MFNKTKSWKRSKKILFNKVEDKINISSAKLLDKI